MSQSHGVSEPSDDKLRQYGLAKLPTQSCNHGHVQVCSEFWSEKEGPPCHFWSNHPWKPHKISPHWCLVSLWFFSSAWSRGVQGGDLAGRNPKWLSGSHVRHPLGTIQRSQKKNIKMDAGGKSIKHIIYFCVFCLESPVFRSIPFPAFGTWPRRPSRVHVAKQDSIFLWSAATACGFPRLRLHHLLMWRMMENIIGV